MKFLIIMIILNIPWVSFTYFYFIKQLMSKKENFKTFCFVKKTRTYLLKLRNFCIHISNSTHEPLIRIFLEKLMVNFQYFLIYFLWRVGLRNRSFSLSICNFLHFEKFEKTSSRLNLLLVFIREAGYNFILNLEKVIFELIHIRLSQFIAVKYSR